MARGGNAVADLDGFANDIFSLDCENTSISFGDTTLRCYEKEALSEVWKALERENSFGYVGRFIMVHFACSLN